MLRLMILFSGKSNYMWHGKALFPLIFAVIFVLIVECIIMYYLSGSWIACIGMN